MLKNFDICDLELVSFLEYRKKLPVVLSQDSSRSGPNMLAIRYLSCMMGKLTLTLILVQSGLRRASQADFTDRGDLAPTIS